jgi:MGT family glycosyltransferase
MAKILITSIPYWGHVNVTLSLGSRLIEQGHEVTWAIAREMPGLSIPEGGRLVLTNPSGDKSVNDALNLLDSAKGKAGLEGTVFVTENVLLPLGKMMFQGLSNVIDEIKPDIIIHDEQTYIGGVCAALYNIPYITTHAAPPNAFEGESGNALNDWYVSCMQAFQSSFGLAQTPLIIRSRKLGLAFCPQHFAQPDDLADGQFFVGPCLDTGRTYLDEFSYEFFDGPNKSIMVSIGTLLEVEAKSFYQKIVVDLGDKPYNVLIAGDPTLFASWPSNFMVQKRVPHLDILPYLDLVITHGGANTTCDCIGMGIPMVVVPMAFDQFYVAEQVVKNGLGLRLRHRRLKAGQIIDACEKLLAQNNPNKAQLKAFSNTYTAAGGAIRAAVLVNQFIHRECPNNV